MLLEDYFDFTLEGAIRLKNSRIGLEHIIRYYKEGDSPEELNLHFPSLTLEQIHATILYYLANRPEMDEYINKIEEEADQAYLAQQKDPATIALKARFEAFSKSNQPNKIGV